MQIMTERACLEGLGREIEARCPGTLTQVVEAEAEDRPWVIHVYGVDPATLAAVNLDIASSLVDAMERFPALDAVGMAHSIEMTAKCYQHCVRQVRLMRALEMGGQLQAVLGSWSGSIVETSQTSTQEPSTLPSESDVQWFDLIQAIEAPTGHYTTVESESLLVLRERPPTYEFKDRRAEAA